MAKDYEAVVSAIVENQHYVAKCHELLDGVNIPQDVTNAEKTMARQLFTRLSAYIDLKEQTNGPNKSSCVPQSCDSQQLDQV